MYTDRNFKTKKDLKEAVEKFNRGEGEPVTYFQPGPFGGNEPKNGKVFIEGPREYHRWYANCQAINGNIVKVK